MSKPTNTNDAGLAINGFDPVAYFSGAAAEGSPDFTASHNGATYRFTSAANRDAFAAEPDTYAPQYGGFCATAMSEGKVFEVDPTNFKVTDNRLFLFYKGEGGDTLPEWNADEAVRKANANTHWQNETYAEHE